MLVLLLSPLTGLHCFHDSRSFMTNNSFVHCHQFKLCSMSCTFPFSHNQPCLCCNTEIQQRRPSTTPATPNLYNEHPQHFISNSPSNSEHTHTHTTTNRQTKTPNNPPTKKPKMGNRGYPKPPPPRCPQCRRSCTWSGLMQAWMCFNCP